MCKRVTAHTPCRFGLFIWRKRITNRESAAAESTEKTQDPMPAVVLLVVCLVAAISFCVKVEIDKYICIVKKKITYH